VRSITAGDKHKETETQRQRGRKRGKETFFLSFSEKRGQSVFAFFNVTNFTIPHKLLFRHRQIGFAPLKGLM